MAKTKLSISLVKEHIAKENIVREGIPSVSLQNGKTLYYKEHQLSVPKWVNSFFLGSIQDVNPFTVKSTSAVILYEVEVKKDSYRIFALSFGHGRNLLNSDIIEERFGLITALNMVNYEQLRSVDINSLESVPLNNRIQLSALAGIGNFNIDIDKDMLKSVTGKSSLKGGDVTVSGADSLSISTAITYDIAEDFLKLCYSKFESKQYLQYFDWIDQMKSIKEKELVNKLDDLLISELNKENPSNVWISIPEILDWNRTDYFQVCTKELYDDIDISKLKCELEGVITLDNLKTMRISSVDEQGSNYKGWSIYRCIYADISNANKQYILNDGKWYELASSFVKQVNEFYEHSSVSKISIPDYSEREEEKYNKLIEQQNDSEYFLMDRKTVVLGGTPIEFCDIYTKHNQFVHVKRYHGSAVLSHLFFQGLVSAESFFDKQFRLMVNSKLERGFSVESGDSIIASDYEVVYVIARENAVLNKLPEIPFFSKVAFRNTAKRLKMYGYNVSITGVPYTYDDSSKP